MHAKMSIFILYALKWQYPYCAQKKAISILRALNWEYPYCAQKEAISILHALKWQCTYCAHKKSNIHSARTKKTEEKEKVNFGQLHLYKRITFEQYFHHSIQDKNISIVYHRINRTIRAQSKQKCLLFIPEYKIFSHFA